VDRAPGRLSGLSEATRQALEDALGHHFARPELLATALAHPSWSHERDGSRGNERLEFLGDAVLELVVGELLYEAHPGWDEGTLTRARAALVNTGALAARARLLDLGPHLLLGRSERASGGAEKERILADAFEAVLGALYLDGGLAAARRLALRVFADALRDGVRPAGDAKTRLNEWAQARCGVTPVYLVVDENGREDDPGRWCIEVEVAGARKASGRGRTKREAEQAAAAAALEVADAS